MEQQRAEKSYPDNMQYQGNIGLVHTIARRGYARLLGAGVGVDYEDIFQEISTVFLKTRDKFDPNNQSGAKFSTYFCFSAWNHFNKMAEKMISERCEFGVMSLEEMTGDEDGDMDILDHIGGNAPSPEEILELRQDTERIHRLIDRTCSPLTKQVISWMIKPPQEMEDEFCSQQDYAKFARNQGVDKRARKTLSVDFICDVLRTSGVNDASIKQVKEEIRDTIESL